MTHIYDTTWQPGYAHDYGFARVMTICAQMVHPKLIVKSDPSCEQCRKAAAKEVIAHVQKPGE